MIGEGDLIHLQKIKWGMFFSVDASWVFLTGLWIRSIGEWSILSACFHVPISLFVRTFLCSLFLTTSLWFLASSPPWTNIGRTFFCLTAKYQPYMLSYSPCIFFRYGLSCPSCHLSVCHSDFPVNGKCFLSRPGNSLKIYSHWIKGGDTVLSLAEVD